MEKEKTAVEFLYEFVLLKLSNEQQMQFEGLFQQAKQMEKEQIVKAHTDSLGGGTNPRWKELFQKQAEQYYESKYGKDENKAENNS